MDLAIVIPVYNEEKTIKTLIEDLYDLLHKENISYGIFIINDGSTDNSLSLIRDLHKVIPNIELTTRKNSGHGPSVLHGYNLALNSNWVFQLDSDYQYSLNAFHKIWPLRQQYDLLIAERVFRNASFPRRIVSLILKALVFFLYGNGIKDINVPYRLMRTVVLKEALCNIKAKSFAPNTLITAYFIKKNLRIFSSAAESRDYIDSRKSKMSGHIFKGCITSIVDLILFRFKK